MAELFVMTLADHAEAWAKENGEKIPRKGTKAWEALYQRWVAWAFKGWSKDE